MTLTFHLVLLTWLFFRARPVGEDGALAVAIDYLLRLGGVFGDTWIAPPVAFWLLSLVVAVDVLTIRAGTHFWVRDRAWYLRGTVTALLLLLGFVLGSGENRAFIYFQF